MKSELELKLDRIETLKKETPAYNELFEFYKTFIKEKINYINALKLTLEPMKINASLFKTKVQKGFPLLENIDLTFDYPLMEQYFSVLLSMFGSRLENEKKMVCKIVAREKKFKNIIQKFINNIDTEDYPVFLTFLINETINPVREVYASDLKQILSPEDWDHGYCPVCGGQPFIGILKGEAGKKNLICSACMTQWGVSRIKCHHCGADDPKTISCFIAADDDRYRIEICDNCKTYLKIIDLRQMNQETRVDIENIASIHMDILAKEKGYANNNQTFWAIP